MHKICSPMNKISAFSFDHSPRLKIGDFVLYVDFHKTILFLLVLILQSHKSPLHSFLFFPLPLKSKSLDEITKYLIWMFLYALECEAGSGNASIVPFRLFSSRLFFASLIQSQIHRLYFISQ